MENITTAYNWLVSNWEFIAMIITGIVALTPTDNDNNAWERVKNLVGKIKPSSK